MRLIAQIVPILFPKLAGQNVKVCFKWRKRRNRTRFSGHYPVTERRIGPDGRLYLVYKDEIWSFDISSEKSNPSNESPPIHNG